MIQEEILKISSVFQKSLKEIIREKINLGSAFMVTFRPDTSWENVIEIDEDEDTYTVMLNEETLLYTFIEKSGNAHAVCKICTKRAAERQRATKKSRPRLGTALRECL